MADFDSFDVRFLRYIATRIIIHEVKGVLVWSTT
jgi:hypothetical protein